MMGRAVEVVTTDTGGGTDRGRDDGDKADEPVAAASGEGETDALGVADNTTEAAAAELANSGSYPTTCNIRERANQTS